LLVAAIWFKTFVPQQQADGIVFPIEGKGGSVSMLAVQVGNK